MPSLPRADRESPTFIKALGLWDVTLMTVVAVVSPRWITRSASVGAPAMVLWLLAGLLFGVPLALAAIALARRYPEQGGMYPWTQRAFGPLHGFLCGWCYWLSNLFFFPSILLFAAANALTILGPGAAGLADSRAYTAVFVLTAIWICTALNVVGLNAGRWLQRLGTIGVWTPVALIIAAAAVALATTGSATSFAPSDLAPQGRASDLLGLWSSLCFAFVGFEITTFMGQEVRDAKRTIPRAVPIAVLLVAIYYIVGSASVLVVLPVNAFSERTGLAEAIDLVGARLALPGAGGLIGLLLAIGYLAITNSWMAGAARIPFAAGEASAMPAALARLHPRYRTPHVAIVVQGIVASAVFLFSLFLTLAGAGTTVMEAYDILVGLTIIANLIPYFYLFAALVRLARREAGGPEPVRVAGGRPGLVLVVVCGIAATAVAIALTFVPPSGTGNVANYEANLVLQTAAVVVVGLLIYWWERKKRRPKSAI
jgi:amino acid transporter